MIFSAARVLTRVDHLDVVKYFEAVSGTFRIRRFPRPLGASFPQIAIKIKALSAFPGEVPPPFPLTVITFIPTRARRLPHIDGKILREQHRSSRARILKAFESFRSLRSWILNFRIVPIL